MAARESSRHCINPRHRHLHEPGAPGFMPRDPSRLRHLHQKQGGKRAGEEGGRPRARGRRGRGHQRHAVGIAILSGLGLLRQRQGVLNLDAEVAHRTFELGVTQ